MGCDGGTIPRRDELVKIKKKPEQKDKEAELAFRWRHCSIKQLPLQEPVVACGLGRLYSKESVLEGLLDRTMLPETAQHIKNLKDIKTLNLTPNPAYEGDIAKNGGYLDDGKSRYICPVIGLEMTGKHKFCFLWNCGCVMSERALKEIRTYTCHKCQQPFTDNDIVVLNAQDEDLRTMEENMIARKAQKKSKKRKNGEVSSTVTSSASTSNGTAIPNKTTGKDVEEVASTSTSNGVIQKIKVEKDETVETNASNGEVANKKVKKIKEEKPLVSRSVMSKSKLKKPEDPAYQKAKKDYSIAQDPNASEVLKSIFTSHKSAATQERAHWVTYNPFYN